MIPLIKDSIKAVYNNPTVQRYLLSSVVSFLTAFFLSVAAQIASVDSASITLSIYISFFTVAVRAGIKAIAEGFVGKTGDKIQ